MMSHDVTRHQRKAQGIVAEMTPWFTDIEKKRKPSHDGRTVNEQNFDSGVFAAAELVRRLTDDEALSLAIHEACIWRQREVAAAEQPKPRSDR